jgi:hypothetical protein
MGVAPSSALYYPTIDIPDETWLRNACLIWDSIRTIVPVSFREPYAGRLSKELADEGILFPIRVESGMDEIESLTDDVMQFLTDPESMALTIWETGKNQPPPRPPDEYVLMNANKLPDMIRSQFEQMQEKSDWYRVEPDFSRFYITLLATRLAGRLGLGLVTGTKTADALATSVRKGRVNLYSSRRVGRDFDASGSRRKLPWELAPSMIMDLAVSSVSIDQDVPPKELLKFRRDHADELSLLRIEVSKLAAQIPGANSLWRRFDSPYTTFTAGTLSLR